MHWHRKALPAAARAILCLALVAPAGAVADAPFRIDELHDGVLLFRPVDDRPGYVNSLAVEQASGWIVVEAQPSPEAARELLGALRARSTKPVRFLVLSHPQAEAAGGASAFPETTIVVSSTLIREALEDPRHDFGGVLRAVAGPAGWNEPPRRLPTLVSGSTVQLLDDDNPVRIVPMRQAHSVGNLAVFVPAARISYLGPILYRDRNPYAGDADVPGWLGIFNGIISSWDADILVPLHGDPTDVRAVRELRDSLAWLHGQVSAAFIEGLSPEAIPSWVMEQADFGKWFDVAAEPSFHRLLVGRAPPTPRWPTAPSAGCPTDAGAPVSRLGNSPHISTALCAAG